MKKKLLAISTLIVISFIILVGCQTEDEGSVVIGGKDFTEQYVMAEMLSILIEENTSLNPTTEVNLGVAVIHSAIETGDIDMSLEYTGTGLINMGIDIDSVENSEEAYEAVDEAFEEIGVNWLEPIGFENTFTLTITQETAEEYGLETITDLASVGDELALGAPQGFSERADGLPGLLEHYDFEFQSSTLMAPALMYSALIEGEVDVIAGFTTDGQVAAYDLKTLEDDQQFFPPYDAAIQVRNETLEAHPELEDVLNQLAGRIDNTTMASLNAKVDMDEEEPADVARNFLIEEGLIEE